MKYIDLSLKKHNPEDYKHYTLDQVIEDNNIVVVLGSPGSGKAMTIETILLSLALTHTPEEANFYILEYPDALFLRQAGCNDVFLLEYFPAL